jgi:hypothetical protein
MCANLLNIAEGKPADILKAASKALINSRKKVGMNNASVSVLDANIAGK